MTVVQASGKKIAAMMKKKGIGLFATKTLSADLAAICGKNKMPRTEVTKAIWAYPQARGTPWMLRCKVQTVLSQVSPLLH